MFGLFKKKQRQSPAEEENDAMPVILDFAERLQNKTDINVKETRDELYKYNAIAKTETEQAIICALFVAIMNYWKRQYPGDEKIANLAEADYKFLLMSQSLNADKTINPAKLERVTRREVEAGRLDENDDFRQHAVCGAGATEHQEG
jgi:hypothetical protein